VRNCTYQLLESIRKDRVARKPEAGIEDGQLALVLERGRIIAQFIQQNSQCPNIRLFVYRLLSVYINHFRTPILKGGMLLDILVHEATLDNGCGGGTRRRGRAKIAELEALGGALGGDEDIFNLEIAVEQRGLEVVHACDALGDVGKDVEDLGLG
jgi:hypothetical protein